MNSNNLCYKCNSPIRNNITLCDTCRAERNNAAAILATKKFLSDDKDFLFLLKKV